jgi:hypothetical protein
MDRQRPAHAKSRRTSRTRHRLPMVLAVVLVVLVALILIPSGRMTRASSAEPPRSGLLEQTPDLVVTDCGATFDGSAVVRFPAGQFDDDQLVRVTATDAQGWSSGGGALFPTTSTIVRVHVPAGTPDGDYPVTVVASGLRHGTAHELRDALAVRVRCSAR